MKAQVSFEYLVMVALIIGAVAITYVYVNQQQQIGTGSRQAEIAANAIKVAADNVYAQGPGAKTQISVVFPENYLPAQSSLSGNRILIKISIPPQGDTDIVAFTRGNITGSLPDNSGTKILTLELLSTGIVNVTSS